MYERVAWSKGLVHIYFVTTALIQVAATTSSWCRASSYNYHLELLYSRVHVEIVTLPHDVLAVGVLWLLHHIPDPLCYLHSICSLSMTESSSGYGAENVPSLCGQLLVLWAWRVSLCDTCWVLTDQHHMYRFLHRVASASAISAHMLNILILHSISCCHGNHMLRFVISSKSQGSWHDLWPGWW